MLNLIFKNLKYNICFKYRKYYYDCLKSRSLIEVVGPDSKSYIQGLITNDINGIGNSHGSIYSMFLNAKVLTFNYIDIFIIFQGRVLFDVILYGNPKNNADEQIYIDCDNKVVNQLIKHLKIYKLRKKVITKLLNVYNIGIIY